ncbi:MAG TPA: CRISPR-associated endonuclease Cas2 [Coxiellaceae bacterium]|nr:CRISPR-associated endonuclease Cas2 [Coxiellaceae bacterium]
MNPTINNHLPTKTTNNTTTIQIIKLLGLGLVVSAAVLLSPTLLSKLVSHYLKQKVRSNDHHKVVKSLAYLKRKRFIAYRNQGAKTKIFLTHLGLAHFKQVMVNSLSITPQPWDKQWRLVLFDVPEEHKRQRHSLRRKLKQMGLYHFQRSVFVCPYECQKEIQLLAEFYNLNEYVYTLTCARFPNDKSLIKHFKLHG